MVLVGALVSCVHHERRPLVSSLKVSAVVVCHIRTLVKSFSLCVKWDGYRELSKVPR